MIGREKYQIGNAFKIPNHFPPPKLPPGINKNIRNPYERVPVAKPGVTHLLMLRNTGNYGESLNSVRNRLKKGGINVKNNGTFVAHVASYDRGIPFLHPPQTVVRNPKSNPKNEKAKTRLFLYGVNHVWNLRLPNGQINTEFPTLKYVFNKKFGAQGRDIFDGYKNTFHSNTKNEIRKKINSKRNLNKKKRNLSINLSRLHI